MSGDTVEQDNTGGHAQPAVKDSNDKVDKILGHNAVDAAPVPQPLVVPSKDGDVPTPDGSTPANDEELISRPKVSREKRNLQLEVDALRDGPISSTKSKRKACVNRDMVV